MAFAFLFFDSVGGGEWLVLLAVVLIVVGPRNLPAAARKMGQILSQLRRAADEFKRQIMTMDQEMEKAVNDVKKDYIDVAEDVDKTVTEAASVGEGDGSDSDLGDGGDRAYGRGVRICRIISAVLAAHLCHGRVSGNDHSDRGKYNPQGVEALGPVFLW